ncbi:condensation domain-containing protein [Streptomyces sp. CA-250714]|uniref:condensation domain-containing protein n=1 Tax=Streptomyces sp. CA-250714 TaxID=3240060 RepID=UPI003D8CC9E6
MPQTPQTPPGDGASLDEEETTGLLLALIREELGDESVTEDDDFYAVGGDSLIAVRIVARANEQGVGIRLLDLLMHPSAQELAANVSELTAQESAGIAEPSPPAPPGPAEAGTPGPAEADGSATAPSGIVRRPASALQIGLVYQCEMSEDPSLYNDLIGVRVHGPFDEARFRTALTALLDRHPALRSSFDLAADPEPVQLVHPDLALPLEVEYAAGPHAGTGAEDAACAAAAEAWRARQLGTAFDWETPPLFRCHVAAAAAAAESFRLTVAMHHALMDGWSFATVVTDLLRLYDAAVTGTDPALPTPPPDAHELFVAAERDAVSSAEAARFWRQHAEGPQVLPDRARETPGDASARLSLPFDDALSAGLRSSAAQAATPLKSLLLAVHSWALAHWSGHPDGMVTGVVLNGRPEQPGAELSVGLFLNTMPLRLPTAAGTWTERARAARDAEIAATRYRHYPLARIEEQTGRPPFDVAFNFTDFRVYRQLDGLGTLRVDEWYHADKASHPVSLDYTLDFPGFGTGLLASYDQQAVPEHRLRELVGLVEEGLRSAAAEPSGRPPAPAATPAPATASSSR